MNASATDLITAEGKVTLRKMGWLFEALSIEYMITFSSANVPWLAKSRYHVQKDGDKVGSVHQGVLL